MTAGDMQTAFEAIGQNDIDVLEGKELLAVQETDARARDILDEDPVAFLLSGNRWQAGAANQRPFGAAIKSGKAPLLVIVAWQRASVVEEIVPVLR